MFVFLFCLKGSVSNLQLNSSAQMMAMWVVFEKCLSLSYFLSALYLFVVFTKSVDSNFRAFWLASVTRNIRGYSLFWEGIQNGFSFRDSFKRWILALNEAAAPTNTKQETKCGLLVLTGWNKKNFSLNLQQNYKKWSPKHCQLKR